MKLNKTLGKNLQFETDVLIIGAGPVGLFASFQAGLLGMKSIVIDALEDIGGQLTFLYPNKYIYDIPGFSKILAKDLIKELAIQAQNYNPLFLLEQTAEHLSKEGEEFKIVTSKNNSIKAKAVIIAGGAGTFKPQKLPLNGLEEFEKETILYSVTNPEIFKNKKVVIIGGGDSAVDWALHLSEDIASNVYLIHRRNHFRALPASLSKLNNNKCCELVVPYGVKGVEGNGTKVTKITIEHFISKEQKSIEVDYILPFFGLNRSLGSLLKWNLNIDTINSTIIVNPTTCETNIEGIFAVGDIAKYEHKLKLIMVGFSEASYALHNAWKYVFPNKPFHFLHSTSKN